MKIEHNRDIGEIFADDEVIDRALTEAVKDALRQHKRAGNPVCEWRDGKVVWIPPEEIQADEFAIPPAADEGASDL